MQNFYSKNLRKILSSLAVVALIAFSVTGFPSTTYATTDVFTTSGQWTVPVGVTSVQVSAYAAGGGGGLGTSAGGGGNGGGGGGYAGLNSFSVTPGNVITVSVGIAGSGSTGANATVGGDSMFSASSTLLAKGGGAGQDTRGGVTASGGLAASEFGDVKHSGGNGAAGASNGTTGFGGGGGGGAGTTADGSIGIAGSISGVGGAGGSVGGGSGGTHGTPPTAGSTLGGAGAGGDATGPTNGAAGARGEVDITYTISASTFPGTANIRSAQLNIRSAATILN